MGGGAIRGGGESQGSGKWRAVKEERQLCVAPLYGLA